MKIIIIAFCAISCAYAATAVDEKTAEVLKNVYDANPEGSYHAEYETSNGISSQSDAVLKPSEINKGEQALEVQGSNTYISPEGQTISLTYHADENGYHPEGDHLPTPPEPLPTPDYILRALEYIEKHPYQEKKQ